MALWDLVAKVAKAPLDRWLRAQPGSAEAHFLGGRVALALGDVAGAVGEMARAEMRPEVTKGAPVKVSTPGIWATVGPIEVHVNPPTSPRCWPRWSAFWKSRCATWVATSGMSAAG